MSETVTLPAIFEGSLTDKLPGWEFQPSTPEGGMTYNEFEGYYPDKGGKLYTTVIDLDKAPGETAYYRIRFEAQSSERAYQGVDFMDAGGNALPDNYDVIYAGEKQAYDRVIYAVPQAASIRLFFQSTSGVQVWNLRVDRATVEDAAEFCDRLYATLPPLDFKAPTDAMRLLPKTAAALKNGKPWHVVMLGDSIVQDTFHSQFHSLIKREFPNSNLKFSISMRGSTGCWHYCQADKFKQYVLDYKPDLLIIGGISNYLPEGNPTGTEAIEIVTRAAKAHLGCEVLILSASLSVDTRKFDPAAPEASLPVQPWNYDQDDHAQRGYDKEALLAMGDRLEVPVWDMQTPAYDWLYASGKPYQWFSRDFVHSGERGKQIIGRTLVEYFKTAAG